MSESILLVDDQKEVLGYVSKILKKAGFEVLCEQTAEAGLAVFKKNAEQLSLAILDLDLGKGRDDGLLLLQQMKAFAAHVPIIILSGKGTISSATSALKMGAEDFLEKDAYIEEHLRVSVEKVRALLKIVNENRRLKQENQGLNKDLDYFAKVLESRYRIVSDHPLMHKAVEKCRRLANIPRPVLIRGERGVGKELIAGTIHYSSRRARKPFVVVNCAAFHGELLESELFGHEKGAFTGAVSRKIGRFEQANGGTLFLDEIGNMALDFQEKILRVLEYPRFERVQGTESIEVDVRVLAATNASLEKMMAEGRFREDLYDRLSFETVNVPPVRERLEDIPLLVEHFSARMRAEVPEIEDKTWSPGALSQLGRYHWPGNVRQLKNVVERTLYSAPDATITAADLPEILSSVEKAATTFPDQVARFERQLLLRALHATANNQKKAAEKLGLSYDQFRHYYKKYDLKSARS